MDKIRSIRLLSITLMVPPLILTACGSAQQVGQKVEANPVINVNIPGAVAPSAAANNAPASPAPTTVSASVIPTVTASIAPVTVSVDDDAMITQTIKDNINSLNAGNESGYLDTFDPSSPLKSAAVTVFQAVVQFGVKHELISVSVSSKSANSATVILVRRVTSPMTGSQTERVLCGLNNVNNKWKISTMTIQSTDAGFM